MMEWPRAKAVGLYLPVGVKRHLYQGENSLKVCDLIAFQLLNHLLSKDDQFCLLGALHQRCQGTCSCGLHITAIFYLCFRQGSFKSFSEERIQPRNAASAASAEVCSAKQRKSSKEIGMGCLGRQNSTVGSGLQSFFKHFWIFMRQVAYSCDQLQCGGSILKFLESGAEPGMPVATEFSCCVSTFRSVWMEVQHTFRLRVGLPSSIKPH